ncbi:MAG: bifunctional riboflavin kinase/FAD synthetase [Thermodesulfobacteriota bacterium]
MNVYTSLRDIPGPFPHACVTIGNFDGVHLGHQMLFSEVVGLAYRHQGTSVAITFDPHPLQVVRPELGLKLISSRQQKIELIGMAHLDVLVLLPFTREFAAMAAEQFVDQVLIGTMGVKELVVGYDYAFGKGRQGNIPFLEEQGRQKGFNVTVVEAYYVDGMLASSTKVRDLVQEGRMREVKKLLGRPYQIRGEVAVGKKRGGKILGFPTANLYFDSADLCPRHGVYVCQVIHGGRCYGGVLNIGRNPTFAGERVSAETHIFDFNEDIYGQPIKVNLLRFLREERKFAGAAELTTQIARDVEEAKAVLAEAQQELRLSCEERYNH